MKTHKLALSLLALLVTAALAVYSMSAKSAGVSARISKSLDQAGLKDVTVSQDRDKGVVALAGHVAAESDKGLAGSLAQSITVWQVVANQIVVIPAGVESEELIVNYDIDNGIENSLGTALITNRVHKGVKFAVRNRVVTLTGEVDSTSERGRTEQVASLVANVKQVVNELEVKKPKAVSSN